MVYRLDGIAMLGLKCERDSENLKDIYEIG